MDTTDTAGQRQDAHNIYSKHFWAVFCVCESFVIQYKQTCREIFRYIGWCVANTSSLLGTDCEEKIHDKNADMDYHAALPPDHKAGSDSKRGVSKIVEISP